MNSRIPFSEEEKAAIRAMLNDLPNVIILDPRDYEIRILGGSSSSNSSPSHKFQGQSIWHQLATTNEEA